MSVPMMPEEFKGELKGGGGGNNGLQRKWTDKEIEWFKKLLSEGYSREEIAHSTGRSVVSIELKQKRLGKKNGNYNKGHIIDKYDMNDKFLAFTCPDTILDLYAGDSFYKKRGFNVVTNDINKKIDADYNCDALKLICKLYSENKKFELIDLDPFGSAYECFDLAIKMASKGLVITFGELGHKRWRRYDFVGPHYGIYNEEDFTIERLINEVQRIGRCNKKELTVWASREWAQIGRVWFTIKPLKVTEQWRKDG